jgi:hypothetical protein
MRFNFWGQWKERVHEGYYLTGVVADKEQYYFFMWKDNTWYDLDDLNLTKHKHTGFYIQFIY